MTSYAEDLAALGALSRRQLALFATGCLVRATPFVETYGTELTRRRLEEAVAALWDGLGELSPADAAHHRSAYDEAPEDTPDSEELGDPYWWVMYTLALLCDALDAARPDGDDAIPGIASSGLQLIRNVDAVLERPEHVNGQEELAEFAAREESLRILRSDLPPAEQAARIRALSERRARELPVPTRAEISYTPPAG